ncbi:MAG: tail fiber domain-containing protein [Phycisphaerales bacterium]
MKRYLAFLFGASLFLFVGARARAQTAFTYQGELTSAGANVTGIVDLNFRLFDAPADGNLVGPELKRLNTVVTNGRFTVQLDFGNVFLAGQALWLQVDVRNPPGSGSYTTILPRTAVNSTPLAQGLAGFALSRAGPEVVDQSQTEFVFGGARFLNISDNSPTWQSFTAGKTGALKVQLLFGGNYTIAMSVKIYSGLGTSGTLLGMVYLTEGNDGFAFDNLLIEAGRVYTLSFEGSGGLGYLTTPIPGATGKAGFSNSPWWFRTFVTPVDSIDVITPFSIEAGRVPWSGVMGVPANVANSFSPWSPVSAGLAFTGGSVGIGTNSPQSRLHVAGGNMQIDTNTRLQFGAPGENGDTIYLTRFNYTTEQSGIRMELGQNGTVPSNNDTFIITESGNTYFQFNTQSGGQALKGGGGSWGVLSDARAKHDIEPLQGALDRLLNLHGRTYLYNDPHAAGAAPGKHNGFVAQEVEPFFPNWIGTTGGGLKTLNITGFEALTVEALRDLRTEKDAQIEQLERKLGEEAKKNAELEERLRKLEERVAK